MKKLLALVTLIVTLNVFAQTPQKMSYQAIVRNSANQLVNNQNISMKISVLSGSASGTSVYAETHTTSTNNSGLVALEIGTGTVLSGDFTSIDWQNESFFIKTETDLDGGTNYTIVGTSQLLSVPYALHAKSSETITGTLNESQISDLQNYIVTEVDGSITNEIQDLNLTDNDLTITNNTTATTVDLTPYLDDETVTITAGNGIEVSGTYPNFTVAKKEYVGAMYRWAVFSSYNQDQGWFGQNNTQLFAGVTALNWGNNSAVAADMSSDKDLLLTLFSKKGYSGKNATVWAEEWKSYGSTNSKHAAALFRIENTTSSPIIWVAKNYLTSAGSWGERASIALNGVDVWNSGTSNYHTNILHYTILTIPANRVSTVIFVAGSTLAENDSRGLLLAFVNNSLSLPAGLRYVDDLNTAPNGWGN